MYSYTKQVWEIHLYTIIFVPALAAASGTIRLGRRTIGAEKVFALSSSPIVFAGPMGGNFEMPSLLGCHDYRRIV
jgi:hypothetical protein